MSDVESLEGWKPKFAEWVETAVPILKGGNPKKAFATYPFFKTKGDPFTRLGKPAKQARFALITTGGYSIEGPQDPFNALPRFDDFEPEIRAIPLDVDRTKLRIDHAGYDHRFAKEDINVNLPLDRLRELAEAGDIGSIAQQTHVVMGLQPNVGPLLTQLIPELVETLTADEIEAVLLVPS
jgi:D-proline reductase (dithiol) PrdB